MWSWSEHEKGKSKQVCAVHLVFLPTFHIHGLNIDMVYSLDCTVWLPTAKTNLDANISFCPALHSLLMDLTRAVCLWRFTGTWNCHEVDFHYDSSFYSPPKSLRLSRLLSFDWNLFDSSVSSLTAVNCHTPVQSVHTGETVHVCALGVAVLKWACYEYSAHVVKVCREIGYFASFEEQNFWTGCNIKQAKTSLTYV